MGPTAHDIAHCRPENGISECPPGAEQNEEAPATDAAALDPSSLKWPAAQRSQEFVLIIIIII